MNRSEAGKLGYLKSASLLQAYKEKMLAVRRQNYVPYMCQFCQTPIKYEKRHNRFCTQSCAASFNNKATKPKQTPNRFCLVCGIENNRGSSKFCSLSCFCEHQYTLYITSWKTGKISGLSGVQVSRHIKKYLRRKLGNRCSLCGWNETNPATGNVPVECEHLDGNYKNNQENNLTLLCPNCHSLTSTFRGLNKGKGREKRRNTAFVAQTGRAEIL